MRDAFASEILALATANPRIVLLSGDIGNRLFDGFQSRCAGRFFNCGVAEANMMSMSAGLALSGLRPVVYPIAAFATVRGLEQIRVDVAFQRLPVTIIGVGAGLSYASLNATHHCCEDIGFLRMLPGMTVICPGDPSEVRGALRAALVHPGPVYIRLGKKGEPQVHERMPEFAIGRAIVVRPGRDVCLLSTGTMLATAMSSAASLEDMGISTQVVSFHTVKPLDQELLKQVFCNFPTVASVEEHSVLGGLGGSVAEWLADHPNTTGQLIRLGTADRYAYVAGDQDYIRELYGLTAFAIAERVASVYEAAASNHRNSKAR